MPERSRGQRSIADTAALLPARLPRRREERSRPSSPRWPPAERDPVHRQCIQRGPARHSGRWMATMISRGAHGGDSESSDRDVRRVQQIERIRALARRCRRSRARSLARRDGEAASRASSSRRKHQSSTGRALEAGRSCREPPRDYRMPTAPSTCSTRRTVARMKSSRPRRPRSRDRRDAARIPRVRPPSRQDLSTIGESIEAGVLRAHEAVQGVASAIKRARAGIGQTKSRRLFLFTVRPRRQTELARQLALHIGNES